MVIVAAVTLVCPDMEAALAANARVEIARGALVVAEGDSLTYGQDTSPSGTAPPINGGGVSRSPTPYPESLALALGGTVRVENRGFSGDRLRDIVARWQSARVGDLTIAMFGGNDALNNGGLPGGTTPLPAFREGLEAYARSRRASGSKLIFLLTPPIAEKTLEEKVEPYRRAIQDFAAQKGIMVVDTRVLLKDNPAPWTDGIHLTPDAYRAIGRAMATYIEVR